MMHSRPCTCAPCTIKWRLHHAVAPCCYPHHTLALPALAHAAPTHYPLTLQNCASPLTFQHAPKSAVTIGQAGTEMFYALGLGDRLVGTSLWFNDVPVQYQAQNDKVERQADNDPSFEAVIGKRPELVPCNWSGWWGRRGLWVPVSSFTN